jgi:hypothetical protein
MDTAALLGELARHLGVNELALDHNGVCRLVFDGKVVVDLEPSRDGRSLHMCGVVARIPAEGREGLFAGLLDANYFGQGTGRAVLAIDSQNNEVVLQQQLELETLAASSFAQELQAFTDRLEDWQRRMERGELASASRPAAAPPTEQGLGGGFLRA